MKVGDLADAVALHVGEQHGDASSERDLRMRVLEFLSGGSAGDDRLGLDRVLVVPPAFLDLRDQQLTLSPAGLVDRVISER